MKIDASKMLKELKKPRRKGADTHLYLNTEQWREFKAVCAKEGIAPSRVVDMLIASFLGSKKKK